MNCSSLLRDLRHCATLARVIAGCIVCTAPLAGQTAQYYPERWTWETRAPEQVGMNAVLLEAAIEFAQASESQSPRDLLQNHLQGLALAEPHSAPIGPFKTRGDMTGIIVRRGYIVAEWGDPTRVDMTFSVTKSFLSTTVGLAWDRG